MNLTINPQTKTKIDEIPRLAADGSATFTAPPSALQVAEYVANVREAAEAAHEARILMSPGVAEGFAQANSVIENWRASLH